MSEYLGWTERKPPREFDYTRLDRDCLPGGPATQSYEAYVKNIFRPETSQEGNTQTSTGLAAPMASGTNQLSSEFGFDVDDKLQKFGDRKISAAAILRMENQLGKLALDDANDSFLRDYLDYGTSGVGNNTTYCQYPVYTPKSSSEYFSVMNSLPNPHEAPANYRGSFRSYREREDDWKKTDRQMLVDYKDFNSSPLSPYMYRDHNYVQRQDSRIVGSNFVQLTTRPRDRFLEKIDKTLAEVRAMPRY